MHGFHIVQNAIYRVNTIVQQYSQSKFNRGLFLSKDEMERRRE